MYSVRDVCHELLGHAPLFADPAFAQFSQVLLSQSFQLRPDFVITHVCCSGDWAGIFGST